MFEKIPVPVKGQPARASWGAGVANRVNEIGAMFPSRGLARDGLTGTGFAPLPANRRDRRGGSSKIPGRFEILSITPDEPPEEGSEEEQTYSATFANPYYDIGGKTYEMPAGEEQGPVRLESIPDDAIVILVVDASGTEHSARLDYCQSIQELQAQQENDVEHYTIPLYRVQGGKVVCDFRTGPISGMGEP